MIKEVKATEMPDDLRFTYWMLLCQRGLAFVLGMGVGFGGTFAAIQENNSPILGALTAVGVGVFLIILSLGISKWIERGLIDNKAHAWWWAVRLAIGFVLFGIGILALRELFSKEIRERMRR